MKHQQNCRTDYIHRYGYCFVLHLILFTTSLTVAAQDVDESRDANVHMAYTKAVKAYEKQIGKNSMVHTGRSYHSAHIGVKGHQFFFDDYWETGRVVYDKNVYDDVFLKYDTYSDELLLEHFNSNGHLSPITLFKPKVSSFHLHGHYFVRLEKDTMSNFKEGFYDLLYEGNNLRVLVKRKKEIVKSNEINTLFEKFIEKDKYFIKKGALFYQVRNKRSVLKALEEHKKELKSHIRSNNFYFKHDPEKLLVEVCKYYDSLFHHL